MENTGLFDNGSLSFSCDAPVTFGTHLELEGMPTSRGNEWVVPAVVSGLLEMDLHLSARETHGDRFIVVRRLPPNGKPYAYSAIPLDKLE